ncbi:MAG: glycoside hydrolase family 9, partial [Akkermansiaceae bacterium]|nr:glycoside hydrolase family 9 [Verrucomicrobiales bacterium]
MFPARICSTILALAITPLVAADLTISDDAPLELPKPGAHQLRILTPHLLELTLITTKKTPAAPPDPWNLVDRQNRLHAPDPKTFQVLVDGKPVAVQSVGFKRRVLYAPLKERDLRIGNYLYLQLGGLITSNQTAEVRTTDPKLWPASTRFSARDDPLRWSPAIHVNQAGYLPAFPKTALVGYYLGSFGELEVVKAISQGGETSSGFQVLDRDGKVAFAGRLKPRGDQGFPFATY